MGKESCGKVRLSPILGVVVLSALLHITTFIIFARQTEQHPPNEGKIGVGVSTNEHVHICSHLQICTKERGKFLYLKYT